MGSNKGIRLSEKHGVNPSICTCAFCGEDKGIALFGRMKGDAEAPRKVIMDFEPCDKCKENWKMGAPLLRVTATKPENGMPPISEKDGTSLYITGQYAVITVDAAKRLFDIDAEPGSPVIMEDKAFDQFMAEAKKANER